MNRIGDIVFINRWLRTFIVIVLVQISIVFAQEERRIQLKAGDLIAYVDMYSGNFSLFDSAQGNLDFASLLFGTSSIPSSYFEVYIDGQLQTIDMMVPQYPLGLSLNSQIDGIYLAGINQDVRIEFAFFPVDMSGDNDFNTLGLAVNVSNLSAVNRKVSVRFLLDSDIGETRNAPLLYLPSGEQIIRGTVFGDNQIPPFLFFGQKDIAEVSPIGTGFYLYPFIAQRLPDKIIIGNWRRVRESSIKDTAIDPSFIYNRNTTKDLGVAVYFGDFILAPNQSENVGLVLSKSVSILQPVLNQDVMKKGVFNTNRFEAEELLNQKNPITLDRFLDKEIIEKYIPAVERFEISKKREEYRKSQLGWFNNTNINPTPLEKRTNTFFYKNSNQLKGSTAVWKTLYELNWELENAEKSIDEVLELTMPSNNIYTTIPGTGIIQK